MKQEFSDRASFLKAAVVLREATFYGTDLVHDERTHTLTLSLTRAEPSGGSSGFFGGRKSAWLRTVLTIRKVTGYKQSLALEQDDVYVFDRAEVGRGGAEIALYFRPGDRAVLDVEQIDGTLEDTGRATSVPKKPVIRNPLAEEEARSGRKKKTP